MIKSKKIVRLIYLKVHCVMQLSLSYKVFSWHPLNNELQIRGYLVIVSYLATLSYVDS